MTAQLSREELKQQLIECSQNASGMFEIGEDTMCAMMALIDVVSGDPVAVPDEQHSERFDWTYEDWSNHLGGRHQNNDPACYYEFGSFMAVAEMLRQFGNVQRKAGWNACRAAMLAPGVMYDPRTATTGSATIQAVAPVAVPDELLYMAADAIEDLLKNGNRDSSAAAWIDLPGKLRYVVQSFGNSEQLVSQCYMLPAGWKLVPVEPTEEMLNAAWVSHGIYHPSAYRTMLAAAPAAPEQQNGPQNIPENIPSGLIEAVNRLLNNDGSRGRFSAFACHDAHEEIERLLVAASDPEEESD